MHQTLQGKHHPSYNVPLVEFWGTLNPYLISFIRVYLFLHVTCNVAITGYIACRWRIESCIFIINVIDKLLDKTDVFLKRKMVMNCRSVESGKTDRMSMETEIYF